MFHQQPPSRLPQWQPLITCCNRSILQARRPAQSCTARSWNTWDFWAPARWFWRLLVTLVVLWSGRRNRRSSAYCSGLAVPMGPKNGTSIWRAWALWGPPTDKMVIQHDSTLSKLVYYSFSAAEPFIWNGRKFVAHHCTRRRWRSAAGKVLVIDEAYNLDDTLYGKQAWRRGIGVIKGKSTVLGTGTPSFG